MTLSHRVAAAALIAVASAVALHAQLSFEVATIRPSTMVYAGGSMGPKPGRYVAQNVAAVALIAVSHNLKFNQILGGPPWIRTDRYFIEGTTGAAEVTPEQAQEMIRSLLANRFKLRAHRETRPRDGFALVRVSGERLGPSMQPSTLNCRDPKAVRPQGSRVTCGLTHLPGSFIAGDIPMSVIADLLAGITERAVEDRTRIFGTFDVELKWDPGVEPSDLPSIFTAVQEQLGLRLQREEMPSEVLIIDHIERPTEN